MKEIDINEDIKKEVPKEQIYGFETAMQSVTGFGSFAGDLFPDEKDIIDREVQSSSTVIADNLDTGADAIEKVWGHDGHAKMIKTENNQKIYGAIDNMESLVKDLEVKTAEQKRMQNYYAKHFNFLKNNDIAEYLKHDDEYYLVYNQLNADFPMPNFIKKDENGNVVKDKQGHPLFEKDEERYARFVKETPFYKLAEESQRFFLEEMVPFIEAKKAGKADGQRTEEFTEKYEAHLIKMKGMIAQIRDITDEQAAKWEIYPFAKNRTALEMNWRGARFGEKMEEKIDNKIRFLKNGWSLDDIEFFLQLKKCQNVEKKRGNEKNIKTLDQALNKALETKVETPTQRRRTMNSILGSVRIYEASLKREGRELPAVVAQSKERAKEDRPYIATGIESREKFRNKAEQERQRFAEKLKEQLKKINTTHRGGGHEDSQEIIKLRNSTTALYNAIKYNTTDYPSKEVDELIKEVQTLSRAYVAKKRENAEVPAENTTWTPHTRMGQRRFSAAQNLSDLTEEFKINTILMTERDLSFSALRTQPHKDPNKFEKEPPTNEEKFMINSKYQDAKYILNDKTGVQASEYDKLPREKLAHYGATVMAYHVYEKNGFALYDENNDKIPMVKMIEKTEKDPDYLKVIEKMSRNEIGKKAEDGTILNEVEKLRQARNKKEDKKEIGKENEKEDIKENKKEDIKGKKTENKTENKMDGMKK